MTPAVVRTTDSWVLPGRAVTVREGDDVTIISNGTVLWRPLAAAEMLADDGINARVLSMPMVKPLDIEAIVTAGRETKGIVTAEEATSAGGLGGAVAETVMRHHPTWVTSSGSRSSHPPGRPPSCLTGTGCQPRALPTRPAEWLDNRRRKKNA